MRTLTLTCNHCGESLAVPEGTRFLTCAACSSQLEVRRSGSTAYTEVLAATETAQVVLELEKLNAEWTMERERLGSVSRLHSLQLVMYLALIMGLVLAGYGVDVDMKHLGGPGPGPVPYVCIILGIALVLGWIVFFLCTGGHRARIAEYQSAELSYQYRAKKLLESRAASKRDNTEQSAGCS